MESFFILSFNSQRKSWELNSRLELDSELKSLLDTESKEHDARAAA